MRAEPTANEHHNAMRDFLVDGKRRALQLPNRGPIKYNKDGAISSEILDSYWRYGFYVFTGVIQPVELDELRADVERVLDGAPSCKDDALDRYGRPAIGQEFRRTSFSFSRPLSDPLGGSELNHGRHPVKMAEPKPDANAPEEIIDLLIGNLQIMDRAYVCMVIQTYLVLRLP